MPGKSRALTDSQVEALTRLHDHDKVPLAELLVRFGGSRAALMRALKLGRSRQSPPTPPRRGPGAVPMAKPGNATKVPKVAEPDPDLDLDLDDLDDMEPDESQGVMTEAERAASRRAAIPAAAQRPSGQGRRVGALPPGATWALITRGSCLEGSEYPQPKLGRC